MTQSQLRTYMSNYLKNQGTWRLSQLKKLKFEEIKEEFDKMVKNIETFVPMGFEATKAKSKRFGEELQSRTPKKQKVDDKNAQPTEEKIAEAKDEEPTKKIGKRRKQIARKGLHTHKDETDEASEKDKPSSGTNVPINHVPVATKPPSIANYKIIKLGKRGVYQIVRANGTYKVYMSFGSMLKEITRDDLIEVNLKTMFDAPLSTDVIWSLPGQQRILVWTYYETSRVHCLNLDSAEIYMLIERKYPLSAHVCEAILNKKLQGGKENEDCYKLLRMMEKQAGLK
ncbi:hypothetical protein Tco_0724010 [Tanacetum coccineum]